MKFSLGPRRRSQKKPATGNANLSPNLSLYAEALEPRMMLSTFEIIAAGSTNQESIDLQIDGATVQSFDNIGGNAYGGETVSLTYSTGQTVTADQVRILFTNDLYDPDNNIDRNVRIDAIVIDGVRFETESPEVYSTGTWLPEDGLQPGFRQNEFLTSNGYFQYADSSTGNGSLIEVRARGDEGTEQFEIQIDGQAARLFSVTQTDATYSYTADGTVTADQVRIVFINDVYDPDNGVDANLIVDFIDVDGTRFETEAPTVYSTGTWLPDDGITPGFRQSEILHTNGYFEYEAGVTTQPGTLSLTLDALTINEDQGTLNMVVFRTDGSDGVVTVDYATFNGSVDNADYTPVSGTLTFADGITDRAISVTINDDNLTESSESFTLVLSNPTGGATLGAITSQTITIDDNDEFTGGVVYQESFESGFNWTTNPNGTDQATTGQWEIGAPQATSSGSTNLQLNSGSDGARALITGLASGSSIGTFDVDSGVTTTVSPTIALPDAPNIELRFDYYLAHMTNATSADFFSASVVDSNGAVQEVFRESGTSTLQSASWSTINIDLSSYSGQTIQVMFSAADASTGSLIEAGVDQVIVEAQPNLPGVLSVDQTVINVDEAAGNAVVNVVRSGGLAGAVSVGFSTATGTAGTNDFTAVSGTLNFADGQSQASITIPITDDNSEEQLENFTLTLAGATGGATIGNDSTSTITIVDNDNVTSDFLPDLVSIGSTLTEQLRLDTTEISGRTLLRFSSEVGNAGTGPLEIWGGSASGTTQEVFQRIYQEGGGSRDVLAGEFVYHANHGHIHFEGFANYNLRTTDASDTIVASGGKTSFCLINIRNPFQDVTANADVVHGRGGDNCGQFQGLSAGFSDVYSSSLPDQWIDVTDVADGTYWLEVITDPDDAILEADETNNAARVQVTISNGQVTF